MRIMKSIINIIVITLVFTTSSVSSAELFSISLADDSFTLVNDDNPRIFDGKRKEIDNKLSMEKQIYQLMPRDVQRDNIYEGLSTDLYNLNIRF